MKSETYVDFERLLRAVIESSIERFLTMHVEHRPPIAGLSVQNCIAAAAGYI